MLLLIWVSEYFRQVEPPHSLEAESLELEGRPLGANADSDWPHFGENNYQGFLTTNILYSKLVYFLVVFDLSRNMLVKIQIT